MGLVATASPYSRRTCETQNNTIPWKLKVWVCLQAVLSAVRLYVSYAMLAYLPLGDAVTIMFVEPLFTLVFSFLFLRLSASLWRILLCFGLLLGMVFTVQPPFVFGRLQVKKTCYVHVIYLSNVHQKCWQEKNKPANSISLSNKHFFLKCS